MARNRFLTALQILFSFTSILVGAFGDSVVDRKVYIMYMGRNPEDEPQAISLHHRMLHETIGSDASNHLRHSYTKSFHGFSATLTEDEAQKLAGMEGVLSVFQSQKAELHTTRTWDFLNMPLNITRSSSESNVIVGVIDTGVWPWSESFNDKGYGPPPMKWKGICQKSVNFTCNNKIIGARYFRANKTLDPRDLPSPVDTEGHGSHTASTVAGNIVYGASFQGIRQGTARGGVPRARIAVYKACWADSCYDEDLLAAFDAAIADGVDLISISLDGQFAKNYFQDTIAIGSFHAMERGILTVQSAGNNGPNPQTIKSVAPWILTVGASTLDRKIVTPVKLGDNLVYNGLAVVNPIVLNKTIYPLIYAGDAARAGVNVSAAKDCEIGSLDRVLVKDKIVLCDGGNGNEPVSEGAFAAVVRYDGPYFDSVLPVTWPVSFLPGYEFMKITNYEKSTRNATAVVLKSVDIIDKLAPTICSFSSRGPNPINNNILKPDLTAPGSGILAAWTPLAGVPAEVPFSIDSGTSMACPHVTGAAAYIKTFHPMWSPAAIKSALMTTATPVQAEFHDNAEFAYGSGQINPTKALDPGLVYDADESDYVNVLCEEGYPTSIIVSITHNKNSSCSSKQGSKQLNYPSIVIPTIRNYPLDEVFTRTVTNVGSPSSMYKAVLDTKSLNIKVEPAVLKFQKVGQKLSFLVRVEANFGDLDDPIVSASLTWDDGVHNVRSPIVVYVPT